MPLPCHASAENRTTKKWADEELLPLAKPCHFSVKLVTPSQHTCRIGIWNQGISASPSWPQLGLKFWESKAAIQAFPGAQLSIRSLSIRNSRVFPPCMPCMPCLADTHPDCNFPSQGDDTQKGSPQLVVSWKSAIQNKKTKITEIRKSLMLEVPPSKKHMDKAGSEDLGSETFTTFTSDIRRLRPPRRCSRCRSAPSCHGGNRRTRRMDASCIESQAPHTFAL